MGLPGGQQRILEQIEGRLATSDPRLTSLFAIFGRLTRGEAMPWLEGIKPRPVADRLAGLLALVRSPGSLRRATRRPAARLRALLLVPAAMVAMACAVTVAAVSPGAQRATPGGKQPALREQVVKSLPCRFAFLRVPSYAC